MEKSPPLKTTLMALVAMFIALIVGTGWALAMVPNVELVTALAFTAGATLGPVLGLITGAGGMFLFSATNPVGSGLAFPLTLGAQTIAQSVIGLSGGAFVRLNSTRMETWNFRLLIATTGLLVTIFYDGLTSISFPLFAGAGPAEILALLISGLAFTVIHQLSNTLLFFLVVPRMIRVSRTALKGRLNLQTDEFSA